MTELRIQVKNPTGLHTRPGTEFVRIAKGFESNITVSKDGKEANAKSLVKVMKLGISQGSEILITAEGSDEQEALQALETYISQLTE